MGRGWGGGRFRGVFCRFAQSGSRDRPLRLTNLSPLGGVLASLFETVSFSGFEMNVKGLYTYPLE